jgi:hypothetical protein
MLSLQLLNAQALPQTAVQVLKVFEFLQGNSQFLSDCFREAAGRFAGGCVYGFDIQGLNLAQQTLDLFLTAVVQGKVESALQSRFFIKRRASGADQHKGGHPKLFHSIEELKGRLGRPVPCN